MSQEIARRIVNDPVGWHRSMAAEIDRIADESPVQLVQLVDQLRAVDRYVKKHDRAALAELRRTARLAEWRMARLWPVNPDGVNRTDDRPPLTPVKGSDHVLWSRIYTVGRADLDLITNPSDPGELTQTAIIRKVQPVKRRYEGVTQGDAAELLADIEPGSVDLILTDPPYGDQSRHLYTWLGEFAARALRPGGSLVVLTGQSRIADDIARLTAPAPLRYWWTFAMIHSHGTQRLPGIFTFCGWKPLLWIVHGTRSGRDMIPDTLRGTSAPDKDQHEWAQSDNVMPIITTLCPEGGLIVDPFAGTGLWGRMASEHGRRWVGTDLGGAVIG